MDRAITSILGKEAVSTFYNAIEETYHLPEANFSKKPEDVLTYLEKILGEAGFSILKRAIITEIRSTFKIEEAHLSLIGTIEVAKKNYLRESINPANFDS